MTFDRMPASGACDRICSQQAEEALRVAEAAHPAQHGVRGVLEGQVEVRRHARRRRDRGHQPGAGLGGLEVGHPDPLDAVDGRELGQQRLEQPEVAEVLAVGRGVLADQEQLPDALLTEPPGLPEHVAGPAGDERAAERRDRAERAPPVAAAGQLERGHRAAVEPPAHRPGARRGRRGRVQVGGGDGVAGDHDRVRAAGGRADRQQLAAVLRGVRVVLLPRQDRAELGGDVRVVVEAEDRVGLGQRLGEVLAVALGQAAHRHDRLRGAVGLEVGRREQGVDGVLLGRLDEAAGVHHHRVGVLRVVDEPETAGLEASGELLGVDLVAGAAEGHQRDGGRGVFGDGSHERVRV